jgi:hypothetical protein
MPSKVAKNQEALLLEKDEENFYRKVSYRYTNMRYLWLLFACCLMVGSYYCFDNPSALAYYLQNGKTL